MTGGWGWMPALGWIFIILFWVLFILGVVAEIGRDRYGQRSETDNLRRST
jgi:hypothetical protein